MPMPLRPTPPMPPACPDPPKSIFPIIPPTMPPPTPRRKLLPPPPDKGEDGEKDLPPEGLDGFPKDFEGLLPNPLLEPPMDLPPLLDLASARSESPRATKTIKSETRSSIRLMDDVLFNIRCLQYNIRMDGVSTKRWNQQDGGWLRNIA
jgi:hypothetical protein